MKMENNFHGFDHLKPDQELKDKTKEKILEDAPIKMVKPARPMLKAAIAACLTIVVVGGSTTAFFLSGSFRGEKNGLAEQEATADTTAVSSAVSQLSEGIYADDGSTVSDIGTEGIYDILPDDDATNGTVSEYNTTTNGSTTHEWAGEDDLDAEVDGDYEAPTTGTNATDGGTTGGTTVSEQAAVASKSHTASMSIMSKANTASKPSAAATTSAPTVSYPSQSLTAGILTAKMWNDNLHFSDWISLLGQDSAFRQYQKNWGINLTKRITVTVKSSTATLPGATVALLNAQGEILWSAVSDNTGKAYLFYNVLKSDGSPARITAKYQGKTLQADISNRQTDSYTAYFGSEDRIGTALDLMFVCDTTGSMGDELRYLQAELEDIILRVEKQNGNIPLRLSVNFYRDEGDAYVLRPFPFTTDINSALTNLKQQYAAQGGDFEEAVDQALNDAIHNHQWSSTATAKLLFLVLDAPPHDADKAEIQQLLADAAERGIRVIPVTASGIDKNTEYLMRAFGIGTGGVYVTLTDDSGVGGSHIEASVGETQVYKLNDLLVKIINSYLQ